MNTPDQTDLRETVRYALHRAYNLGQTYWQQADSESYVSNKRCVETAAKFKQLSAETLEALAVPPEAPEAGEPTRQRMVTRAYRLLRVLEANHTVPTLDVIASLREMADALTESAGVPSWKTPGAHGFTPPPPAPPMPREHADQGKS